MSERALISVPSLLLFAGLLPAQGVGPILARPLALNTVLTPPGAARVTDYTIRKMPNGRFFIGSTWQSSNGLRLAGAFEYDKSANTLTPRNDFAPLQLNTESLSITQDLMTIAYNDITNGPLVSCRSSIGGAWTTVPIQNLPAGAYSLQFCSIAGGMKLIACFNDPMHAPIEIFDYDPRTHAVANPVPYFPHLGAPGNYVGWVMPVDDMYLRTRGLTYGVRPPVGFQGQVQWMSLVDRPEPQTWFNTPLISLFTGGSQLEGGQFLIANAGLPIGPIPPGGIDAFGTLTCDTDAPAQGGLFDITMFGPPGDFGAVGITFSLGTPTLVPPFQNLLGLDPQTFLTSFAMFMPNGVGQITGNLPPTVPIVLAMQGASIGTLGQNSLFGDTSWFRVFTF